MIKSFRDEKSFKYTCPSCAFEIINLEKPKTYCHYVEFIFWKIMAFYICILIKQLPIMYPLEKQQQKLS